MYDVTKMSGDVELCLMSKKTNAKAVQRCRGMSVYAYASNLKVPYSDN